MEVSAPRNDATGALDGLDVDYGKRQHGKGAPGSRENPEVYENIPGHVIPILAGEFDDFSLESSGFLAGEQGEDTFIPFRLKQGVYGQRQADVQMIRVKLPFGGVSPDQLDAFAEVIERWVPLRKGHITTRQNIQMHHVPLADATKLIRQLGEAGLSSREGCGNTVRNVTADPYAGVAADEVFDPTPYAGAYVRYFVRHPVTQAMPRKWKTAFSSSRADRAIVPIHDIGFLPVIRDATLGGGERGFEVWVGGGTAIMPRLAHKIFDFVGADDGEYLRVTEAIVRIFDRQDWLRKNRARARIKVLLDKIGPEAFRELVDEELAGEWVHECDYAAELERLRFADDEEARAPGVPAGLSSPNGDRPEFDLFRERNVTAQRQAGFFAIAVKVTRGDLTPEQFRGLAALMREFCGGNARTTVEQNIILRWVRDEALYELWNRLRELGLADSGAFEIDDVISCPGTDSCKMGITASMGLNEAIQARLERMQIVDSLTRRVQIKMSGCPNGCGQHHIGTIGFYGASLKVGERQMPAYIPHIGGRAADGEVVFGKRLKTRLPAKRVPDAVERWLRMYEAERAEGEDFERFAERVGNERFEAEVKELTLPAEFSLETMEQFIDWNRSSPYEVIRGEGECAI
ncbi:MAG TPA: nitrite/sulfite reductase [Solirubrobacterales bacterium]|nr:nitrite/sulfite reductase [Solirubrobacterales bacterium]